MERVFALLVLVLSAMTLCSAHEMENITGTIFCNNDFSFYVNGELIKEDPLIRHNAINVTFPIPRDEDVVFAIEARDLADTSSGLEFGDRCIGDGGLIAMFSNGVVTNSSWVCISVHYGPSNWKECFGGQTVRNQSLQLPPDCRADSTPPLVGCVSRITPTPLHWTQVGFDDSRWPYALEYTVEEVGWGVPPPNCTDPENFVSSEVDPVYGEPLTCQGNLDWSDSKFIWRESLELDNTLLCRYTMRLQSTGVTPIVTAFTVVLTSISALLI